MCSVFTDTNKKKYEFTQLTWWSLMIMIHGCEIQLADVYMVCPHSTSARPDCMLYLNWVYSPDIVSVRVWCTYIRYPIQYHSITSENKLAMNWYINAKCQSQGIWNRVKERGRCFAKAKCSKWRGIEMHPQHWSTALLIYGIASGGTEVTVRAWARFRSADHIVR